MIRNGTVFLLVLLLGNVETKARVKPLVLVSQEDDASSDEDRRPQNLMIMPKAAYSVVESAVGITKDATVDALTAATTVATVTQASNEINETELNSVDGSGSGDMKPGIAAENTTTQPLEPRVSTEKMPFLNFTITDSVKSTEEPEFIVPDGLGGIIDYSLPPPNQKSEADSIDYFVDVEESVEDADSLLLHWDNHMPPNAIRNTNHPFDIPFHDSTAKRNCPEKGCPSYQVIGQYPEYEVRLYPATIWVSTVLIKETRVLAQMEGFHLLKNYMHGENHVGHQLPDTLPLLTQMKYSPHPGAMSELTDFTVSIPVIGPQAPRPLTNEILVDNVRSLVVLAHAWRGYQWQVTSDAIRIKSATLVDALRRNGHTFFDRYIYLATYCWPTETAPCLFEIWFYGPTNFVLPGQPLNISFPYLHDPPASEITMQTKKLLCRGLECPSFDVLRVYPFGIQKRRYYDAIFATAGPEDCKFTSLSVWKGLMPLHLYRHGINSHLEVMESTRPVGLVHIQKTGNLTCPENITVAFYIPARLHGNPPKRGPAAPSIRISYLSDLLVYTWPVGGYLLEPERVRNELELFKLQLEEFGLCFKTERYFIAFYDYIVRFHGRQNELWVIADNCSQRGDGGDF